MTPGSAPRPLRTGENVILEASAGAGKTRELVNHIVSAVAAGSRVDDMVAVTFTHAAAGEMKLRVRHELDRARQNSTDTVERERLGVALRHLERAFIGTIHAFCAQMLRQRPVEAGIDPAFTELAQPEAERLFASVFQRWIEVKLAGASPVVERALTRSSWREEQSGVGGPMAALRGAAWSLIEWRDFPSPWRREAFHRD
ncbi:MAG: UvrD-helicase domain-containing protein, partial [Bryobacteraceae bacterium]